MSLKVGAGISAQPDPLAGAVEAAAQAAADLEGRPTDVALVFASGAHLAAPEATLEGVHGTLTPAALIGCGAGGVLGSGRELESGTAVAVWAAALDGGTADVFHVDGPEEDEAPVVVQDKAVRPQAGIPCPLPTPIHLTAPLPTAATPYLPDFPTGSCSGGFEPNFGGTTIDRCFRHTFTWKLPTECCQCLSGTLTLKFRWMPPRRLLSRQPSVRTLGE